MELSREELELYLTKIAHYLGEWKVDRRDDHCLYLNGEGMCIFIRRASHRQSEKGRLFFSGLLPREYPGSTSTNSISVSFSRAPKSVACDIRKRLLIDFKQEAVAAKIWLEKKQHERDSLDYFYGLVAQVGFDCIVNGYRDKSYMRTFRANKDNIELKVELSETYKSSIKAENLNKEQLIKLAYFIKSL
jgi:hypothetical protein